MAMRRESGAQGDLVVTWAEMPRSPGHAFYDRLQELLREAGFDAFVEGVCKPYYAARMGAPSLPPGRYFRMHMIGYFESIDSERSFPLLPKLEEANGHQSVRSSPSRYFGSCWLWLFLSEVGSSADICAPDCAWRAIALPAIIATFPTGRDAAIADGAAIAFTTAWDANVGRDIETSAAPGSAAIVFLDARPADGRAIATVPGAAGLAISRCPPASVEAGLTAMADAP